MKRMVPLFLLSLLLLFSCRFNDWINLYFNPNEDLSMLKEEGLQFYTGNNPNHISQSFKIQNQSYRVWANGEWRGHQQQSIYLRLGEKQEDGKTTLIFGFINSEGRLTYYYLLNALSSGNGNRFSMVARLHSLKKGIQTDIRFILSAEYELGETSDYLKNVQIAFWQRNSGSMESNTVLHWYDLGENRMVVCDRLDP